MFSSLMLGSFAVSLIVESVAEVEESEVLLLQLVRIAIAIITKKVPGFMVEDFVD